MIFGIRKTGLLSQALDLSTREVGQLGRTVILAPHPDDESLACGATISLMTQMGLHVSIIFVSDGSQSHPLSQAFNGKQRAQLRREEAIIASAHLGVSKEHIYFMDLPDGDVPSEHDERFTDAAKAMSKLLLEIQPDTVFVPYRLDPHRDHIATWQLCQRALTSFKYSPRIFEYPVWLWELGSEDAYPLENTMKYWKVDTGSRLETKHKAISAHQSQLGNVIKDDPTGFVLTPKVLAHFELPFELFFESL